MALNFHNYMNKVNKDPPLHLEPLLVINHEPDGPGSMFQRLLQPTFLILCTNRLPGRGSINPGSLV